MVNNLTNCYCSKSTHSPWCYFQWSHREEFWPTRCVYTCIQENVGCHGNVGGVWL